MCTFVIIGSVSQCGCAWLLHDRISVLWLSCCLWVVANRSSRSQFFLSLSRENKKLWHFIKMYDNFMTKNHLIVLTWYETHWHPRYNAFIHEQIVCRAMCLCKCTFKRNKKWQWIEETTSIIFVTLFESWY